MINNDLLRRISTIFELTDEKIITTSTKTTTEKHPIPDVVINDEKLKWLIDETKNSELTKENVESLGQETLNEIFYGNKGIWEMNKDTLENQYQIKFNYRGGSKCNLYDNSKKNDRIEVNLKDFGFYLNQRGIKFDKFNLDQYKIVKGCGGRLIKKPKDFQELCSII